MKRLILLMISFCAALFVSAQEEIFSDSISVERGQIKVRQPIMERTLNFDENAFPIEFDLLDASIFNQPLLPDYNKNLDFIKYLKPSKTTGFSQYTERFSFNPVFPYGHVFNQSSYQLNNRLSIGGNSFGARSAFEPPKLNSSIQDMSIKGASMFLQYKVNDRFKVQTRVSISNRPSTPWEP
ncbi:MAG: hypothetical protein Q8R96_06440 [Bacteroidota bacterium]|nr:hypothetical protein [Bacteroidota bacterium]